MPGPHPQLRPETRTETCGKCGKVRNVDGVVKFGRWYPVDGDDLLICPDCGHNIMED